MEDGFLGRWSRRKLQSRQAIEEQTPAPDPLAQAAEKPVPVVASTPSAQTEEPVVEVLPTEEDLEKVKEGGDVIAFMSNKVSSELKNKAFKALFSRPEFNVMDGLDIYIEDYNTFVPLTAAEIDKMALSKQLLARPDLEALEKKLSEQAKETASALLDNEPSAPHEGDDAREQDGGSEGPSHIENTSEQPTDGDSTANSLEADLSKLGHEQNLPVDSEKEALAIRENPSKTNSDGAS